MDTLFTELAVILSLVSLVGFVVFKFKLPLVVAYLLVGVILSLFSQLHASTLAVFTTLPNLGIAFVLFLVGMELDLRELESLGKPIIIATFGQILISTLAGYSIATLLGFPQSEALFLGIGLSFSSTVVIVKLLLEKKDLTSLYGKLSMGITLLEDFVAIIILMLISVGGLVTHLDLQQSLPLVEIVAKGLALFGLTYLLSKYLLEKIFDRIASSGELLFLTAITWCFLFTALSEYLGFSVTIGAFLAGVVLANSPYHFQIQGKIKPLRDFFVTLFFVYLGTQIRIGDLVQVWPIVLIFTVYALVAKPLIYLLILGAFGFRKHTIFQTSINLAQVSEFSLIILLVGIKSGLASNVALSAMASVAVLSVIFSSIEIADSKKIYNLIKPILPFFERKENVHYLEANSKENLLDHIVIIGAHRIGGPIVEYLKSTKIPFVVMDFNPQVVKKLRREHVNVIYGDIGDPEVLDSLQLQDAKLIISTATEITDNETLLVQCNARRVKAPVITRALDIHEARTLKKLGAEYVILPEKVSGDFLVTQLRHHWPDVHFTGLN